jgi:hypothetical protein
VKIRSYPRSCKSALRRVPNDVTGSNSGKAGARRVEEPEDLPGGVIFILPLGGSGEIEAGIVFGLRDFRVPQSQLFCGADAGAG